MYAKTNWVSNKLSLLILILIVISSCKKSQDIESASLTNNHLTKNYIVLLKSNKSGEASNEELNKLITTKIKEDVLPYTESASLSDYNPLTSLFYGFTGPLTDEAVKQLKNNPDVIAIDEDVCTKRESTKAPAAANLKGLGETGWGVKAMGGPFDGKGKRAFIVDSGVGLCSFLNIDKNLSKSFVSFTQTGPFEEDGNGHGTQVASVLGGTASTFGTTGMNGLAKGATIVSIKVGAQYNGYFGLNQNDFVDALDYVARVGNKQDVVVITVTFNGHNSYVDRAVEQLAAKGIPVCIASGNEGESNWNHSPASAEGSNVYVVGSCDKNYKWSSFANYGDNVNVVGPGEDIIAVNAKNQFFKTQGTSVSTPHVAALLLLKKDLKVKAKVYCPYTAKDYPFIAAK